MTTLLAELVSGPLLESGVFPGLQGEAPPLWADGLNVLFENGGVRKDDGLLSLSMLADRPTGLKSTVAEGEPRLFIGAGQNAFRYRSSDGLTNIGTFATSGGIYQFLPWDTWVLISNGSDPIELWQNAGASAPIVAPFTRANTLFGYQLQAFAGGTSNGGRLVEWSPVNAVTDWTQTPTGTAGQLLLRELGGDIVAARRIGRSVGIYSGSDAGVFSFIGGTSIYGFGRVLSGVSAISPYSVVGFGDRHYGITRENVFVTDLTSYQYIDEPAVRGFLRENADWTRMQEVYGWRDIANNMARWVVPTLGGSQTLLGYRVDKGCWAPFGLDNDAFVAGEESGPFPNQFLATATNLFRRDRESPDQDHLALEAFVQTKPLDLGNRLRYKTVHMLILDATWEGDVSVDFAFMDNSNETPVWSVSRPIDNQIFLEDDRRDAVFFLIRIRTTSVGGKFRLNGAKIYGEATGLVI